MTNLTATAADAPGTPGRTVTVTTPAGETFEVTKKTQEWVACSATDDGKHIVTFHARRDLAEKALSGQYHTPNGHEVAPITAATDAPTDLMNREGGPVPCATCSEVLPRTKFPTLSGKPNVRRTTCRACR